MLASLQDLTKLVREAVGTHFQIIGDKLAVPKADTDVLFDGEDIPIRGFYVDRDGKQHLIAKVPEGLQAG